MGVLSLNLSVGVSYDLSSSMRLAASQATIISSDSHLKQQALLATGIALRVSKQRVLFIWYLLSSITSKEVRALLGAPGQLC
ncbi:hypothetical protein K0J45_09750 [Shewanella alkalitolerans]|uniref:hypothetical protein n=1 Tax=Shewanella alkalitolerans TaxID=2864209 RepID=UPI001C660F95|nr:hypothetical protein [Shewanella alkalitolerans]QYJ99450.1 hypothetical protein K0J45_09750 [Shewanella alkalitolerans]